MLRRARYGLPPPPVPRIHAPMARLSISSIVTGLIAPSSLGPRELLEPRECPGWRWRTPRRRRGGRVLEIGDELDGERGQSRPQDLVGSVPDDPRTRVRIASANSRGASCGR